MRRIVFLIAAFAVFAAMAIAVLVREVAAPAAGGGRMVEVTPVIVSEVRLRDFADVVRAIGTARANESVGVTPKVSDVIRSIDFDSGDRVEADQILAVLADTEQAALLNEARATFSAARRERDRFADLVSRGVAPAQRQDETQSAYERAAAQVRAIEARLADRIIRAPFSGVIGLRNISVGELAGPGTVIATLDDISVIKLDFTAPERFLSSLRPGLTVTAQTSAYPDETFEGRIANVDSRIDPVSRTVIVRAEIDNEDGRLIPGMLLTVEVRRDERQRPAIPETAIMRMGDQAFVYVVAEGGTGSIARRRDVTLGMRDSGMMEVLAGLETGERVVTDGTHRVRDGGELRITGVRSAQNGAAS